MSAVPTETIEAARIDGAKDARVFVSVALPMMVPGMVTVFLLQFVGIWNNFLLPFIMLSDERMYPLTVGLYTLLSKGSGHAVALQPRDHRRGGGDHPARRDDAVAAALLAPRPDQRRAQGMSAVMADRPLGTTGLRVPAVVLGTSSLGRRLDAASANTVLRTAAASGWRTWDTSNEYGDAEAFIGSALAGPGDPAGVDPAGFDPAGHDALFDAAAPFGYDDPVQVFTKVDPAPGSRDFSGARVRASVAESLDRLGLDRLPLVHFHDPERMTFDDAMAPDGPVRALLDLREAGTIGHLGVAGGPIGLLRQYVRTGEFEAVVTHNRLTLLDRSAGTLLDDCADRGVGVLNAAPFGGGALADDDGPVRSYHYRAVDPVQEDAVLRIRAIARAAGVPVGALALRASSRDPRVAGTIVGVTSTAQLAQVAAWAAADIPDGVWPELDAALPDPAHWTGELGR